MAQSKFTLVIGGTGQQGGAVVKALLARGHNVRVLTRNAESPKAKSLSKGGVEIAVGDFSDRDSLVKAIQGTDTVFAMSTPFEQGTEKETGQGTALTDAAKEAGAGHLVFSSVASADQATGIPHFDSKFKVEEYIKSSGIPYTIIAPVFFMDNLLAPWMLPGLTKGKYSMAMPGTRTLQYIAVDDIGAFAAAVIGRRDAVFGKRFDIAGDELTGDKAASVLSEVTGRDIKYEGFPPDVMRAQSEDMAIMFEWFDSKGYTADIAGLRRDFSEVNWQTFEEWAKKQDWNSQS